MKNISEVNHILQELMQTNGKLDKQRILRDNDSDTLRYFLDALLNQYTNYGIAKKSVSKKVVVPHNTVFNSDEELIEYLKMNITGSDQVIANVQYYFKGNPDSIPLLGIICKSMKLGLSADTVNKVYGKIIPTFSCQLAHRFEEHMHKIKGRMFVTLKLDGSRCILIKKNGVVTAYTRTGNVYDGLVEFENDFNLMPDNHVFDGELIAKGDMSTIERFQLTQSLTRSKGEKRGLEFKCFDGLPLDEFMEGKSSLKYSDRRLELRDKFSPYKVNVYENMSLVPLLYIGEDKEEVTKIAAEVSDRGDEGVMINLDTIYECKRTSGLLKVKKFQTLDLRCVGIEEGQGRLEGTLGKLLLEYKGGLVGLGSGFSDVERQIYFNKQDEILGKIVEVKYFEETQDSKTGQYSLRFPTFKCVRFDKEEADA